MLQHLKPPPCAVTAAVNRYSHFFSVSREIDSGAVHGMRHRELVCRSSVRVRAAGQRLAGEAWAGGESSDAPPLAGPVPPLTYALLLQEGR